jgi:hypothetical protein
LERAYKTLMERVTVTEEMRARVLQTVRQGKAPSGVRRLKRWLPLAAACLVLVVGSLIAVPLLRQPAEVENPGVQIVSEMVSCQSREELEETVGFSVEVPETLPFTVETTTYTAYGQEMAQVTCQGEDQSAVLRKSPGTEDNSGDFTVYPHTETLSVHGVEVTLKGDGGGYTLAQWTDGSYAYSLRLSPGCGEEEWSSILEALIP